MQEFDMTTWKPILSGRPVGIDGSNLGKLFLVLGPALFWSGVALLFSPDRMESSGAGLAALGVLPSAVASLYLAFGASWMDPGSRLRWALWSFSPFLAIAGLAVLASLIF